MPPGLLFDSVRAAVMADRYMISTHAGDQMSARGILEWQVIEGVQLCVLLAERPRDRPNPIVEVRQALPDGTAIKVVWAWIAVREVALLVTVHLFDR